MTAAGSHRVLLAGASQYGMRALARLGIPFVLVHDRLDALDVASDGWHRCAESFTYTESIDAVDKVDALLARELQEPRPATAVLSFAERGQICAAELSRRHRLTATTDIAAVARTRNKALMRERLAGTVFSWPYVHGSVADICAHLCAAAAPEQPWIVKPACGSASAGACRISDPAGAERWAACAPDGEWIAELVADGDEYSVEAVSFGPGEHQILGITEKQLDPETLVAAGHCFPARLSPSTVWEISDFTCKILTLLGVRLGASHTELRYAGTYGSILIETHTRPGGGEIPELVRLVSGIDQYELAICALLGRACPAPANPVGQVTEAAIAFINARQDGRLDGLDWPAVDEGTTVHQTHSLGGSVRALRSAEDRLGWVLATSQPQSRAGAWETACRIATATAVTVSQDSRGTNSGP